MGLLRRFIYVALIYHRETDHRNDRFIMYDTSNHLMDSYITLPKAISQQTKHVHERGVQSDG